MFRVLPTRPRVPLGLPRAPQRPLRAPPPPRVCAARAASTAPPPPAPAAVPAAPAAPAAPPAPAAPASVRRVPRRSRQGLGALLTPAQSALLARESALLEALLAYVRAHADKDAADLLAGSVQQLKELFLVVVVGEFNSGKSSFINALLGQKYLKDGVTPTTSSIDVLRFGEQFGVGEAVGDRRTVTVPVPWLAELALVDTPGTNAVFRFHQQLTEHFVPRADLVLWVASADRAFSESERQFLSHLEGFDKKVVVVLSKMDLIESAEDRTALLDFVRAQFKGLLGLEPPIFPVSARLALAAKLAGGAGTSPQWHASAFEALEAYVHATLTARERAFLKLRSPLGVAARVLGDAEAAAAHAQTVLRADVGVLQQVSADLAEYRRDMLADYRYHAERVANVILRLNESAARYIDTHITIGNIAALIRPAELERHFQDTVLAGSSEEIDAYLNELVDWLLKRNARQWSAVNEFLQARLALNATRLVGAVRTQFDYNREALIEDLAGGARAVVAAFDRRAEAAALRSAVRAGAYQTAAVELGAVGVGSLLASSLFDVSGLLPASALAVTGLAIIPLTRKRLKAALSAKLHAMHERVAATLLAHFEQQLDAGIAAVRDNYQPYSRFVAAETEALAVRARELAALRADLEALSADITAEFADTTPPR